MISGSVVFYKIATTCLLIFVGYMARRMKLLPENSVLVISRYIVYLALPCYFMHYMPLSVSPESIGGDWRFILLGAGLVAGSDLFGWLAARRLARPGELASFRMLVAMPNWIFMAMAVCEPLFPTDGPRVVLLYNIGVIMYFWSFGMTSFRSGGSWRTTLKSLFLNLQVLANLLAIGLAMAFPVLRSLNGIESDALAALPWRLGMTAAVWETVSLIAGTALPLSILQTGLMLGGPEKEGDLRARADGGNRHLLLIIALRLLAAPILSVFQLLIIVWLGFSLTRNEFVISAIVMAMPTAVLCLSVAETHGGAARLCARVILWSSLASLLTAPIVTRLAQEASASW